MVRLLTRHVNFTSHYTLSLSNEILRTSLFQTNLNKLLMKILSNKEY
jgi:hypothetical protein